MKYDNINITTNNKLKSVYVNLFNDFTTSSVQMGCSQDQNKGWWDSRIAEMND